MSTHEDHFSQKTQFHYLIIFFQHTCICYKFIIPSYPKSQFSILVLLEYGEIF